MPNRTNIKIFFVILACTTVFLFSFSWVFGVYAEGDPIPGNNPNAPRDIANLLTGDDTGTSILGKTLYRGVQEDPRRIVRSIINVAMGFLGAVAVSIIIFAGFKWMTASGNKEQVEGAQRTLIQGVIGLIVIFSAWTISIFVLDVLKETVKGGDGTPSGGLTVEQICTSACKDKWGGCKGACTGSCRDAKTLSGCRCHGAPLDDLLGKSVGCDGDVE